MKMKHRSGSIEQLKRGLAEKGISTRSVVAFFVFGMIVIVFILTDMTGRQHMGGASGSAAEVNGEIISLKDLQEEESKINQYYAQIYGGQFDTSKQTILLRREAINSLVTRELASQAAEKEGIFATDAEVRHTITQELPYFKTDGVFQPDTYKALLASNRMTPSEFEKKIRQDIKTQRARQLFETSLKPSQLQEKLSADLKKYQLNLDYVVVSQEEFKSNHLVSKETINQRLSDEGFRKKVEEYFKSHESEFTMPEQVKASHILIRTGADEAADKKAREKAEQTLKRLSKEDFAKVASQVSEDPGSKTKGGDLGYFGHGMMAKEFEDAAFATEVGKLSPIVKTQFGYHIVKVTGKKAASTADFEKEKNTIAKNLIQEELFSKFSADIEKLIAEGKFEEATTLIKSNGLNWKETGYFNLAVDTVPGLNSAVAMKEASQLSASNPITKKLIRDGDRQFLIRYKGSREQTEASDVTSVTMSDSSKVSANNLFEQWIDQFKKTADIEINTQLFKE